MSKTRGAIAIVAGVLLLLIFLDRFVLVELFVRRAGMAILLALAAAVAIVGAGCMFRRSERPIDNFVIGYPLFGTICFLIATLRITAWTMSVPLVVAIAIGIWSVRKRGDDEARSAVALTPAATFSIAFVGIAAGCAFVFAQAPPASLDEVAYHLAIPRAWINEGHAIELPLISHSYFPLGIESADLPLITILGDVSGGMASHFLHLIAAVSTSILLFRFTRRRASSEAALLVTAAAITTPAMAITAGWSLVDWPLIGICIALVDSLERDDRRGVMAATAAGLLTKYTFIPFAVIAFAATKKWRGALLGSAIGSVFFVRNLVLTGNPLAPFFSSLAPHVLRYRGAPLLADYLFEGHFIDEALGAAVLILLFLVRGRVAGFLVCGAIALFVLAPSSRVLLPFLVVPASFAAVDELRPRFRRAIIAGIMLAIAAQTALVAYFSERGGAFALLAGPLSEQEYLTQARASYASISWLNATLPENSRTLVIGLNETYWFSRRVRGGGNFDGERVSQYLDASTPEALRARLSRGGITHVAVIAEPPPTVVAQKVEERQTRLTPAAQRSLAQMLDRYAASVASRGNATLFTLR